MNNDLLRKYIREFISDSKNNPEKFNEDWKERSDLISYYQSFTKDKMLRKSEEDIFEYISKLWAMLIWGNKHYVVDKLIESNGLPHFKKLLIELVWGKEDIVERWNNFRSHIEPVAKYIAECA